MALDPSIILGARAPQIDMAQFSPMNTLATAMKFKQADQDSQLNALKIKEYERARAEEEGLRNYLSGGREMPAPDLSLPETRTNLLRFGKKGAEQVEALTKQDTATLAKKKGEFDLQKSKREFIAQVQRDTSNNPSDANITAYKEDLMASPLFTDDEKARLVAGVDRVMALPVSERKAFMASQGASASDLKPTLTSQNLGGTTRVISTPAFGGPATTVAGSEGAITMTPAQEREAKDSAQRLVLDARRVNLEGRRVAVLEQNAIRDADPAFQQRMGAARATGEAIAKGDVAAIQALPKIINRAEESVRLIDEMIGKRDSKTGQLLKGEKPHPGFQSAVGATYLPGARFIPGSDTASFMSRHDQIKGASFLEAFESLKGGGAITEKEGAKATDAINRMSTATSEAEYVRAAMDLQDVMRKGVANAQAKAARAGGGGRATGGAVDTSNPLLK
ncbi:hypothetical protein [Limnohabitans sp.]|uniref:hypothetical protein n=1 Tax=Limnohabitans sp. TaxID=1907725 RepID=UPI00333E3F88